MSIKVEAKTLARLNIENCSYTKEQCSDCIADCEFEGTPTFRGRWVSEADVKEQARICHSKIYWEQEARVEGLVAENKKLREDNEKSEGLWEELMSKAEKDCGDCYSQSESRLSAINAFAESLAKESPFHNVLAHWVSMRLGVLLQPNQKTEKFRCSEFGNPNYSDTCLQCPSNSECCDKERGV